MAQLDLGAVMDSIAALVQDSGWRAYAWPSDSVSVPCAVVGYPENIDFDTTFVRGSDSAVIPLWFVVGRTSDRTARDEISRVITGANSIKETLDGDLSGAVQTARVTDCQVEEITIEGIKYISAKFLIEILT